MYIHQQIESKNKPMYKPVTYRLDLNLIRCTKKDYYLTRQSLSLLSLSLVLSRLPEHDARSKTTHFLYQNSTGSSQKSELSSLHNDVIRAILVHSNGFYC